MLEKKIKTFKEIKKLAACLKRGNKKIVFTNGCFDLLHYGHVKYLEDARRLGDFLVIGLNSDSSIRKIKGAKRPIVSQNDRARIIAALESVNSVVIFKEPTPLKLIEAIKPNVLVKGGDWNKEDIMGSDLVIRCGGKVKTINFIKGRSTTGLIKKIAKIY